MREDKEISKKHFTISEVAKIIKVQTSAIRFWEREIPLVKASKPGGKWKSRKYSLKTLEMFKDIKRLTSKGSDIFTLNGMNEYLKFKYRR